jgi:hypothetical protein
MAQYEKIEISNLTRESIVNSLVEPYYKNMVKTTIDGKNFWRRLGISLETSSKLMVALGGIFSFSAGFYQDDTLSFVSGSISCMSLALLQIASFSYKENKKQGEELNILLKKLNLDTIPSMVRSEDQTTVVASSRCALPPSLPIHEQQIHEQQIHEQQIHEQLEELKRRELQLYEIQRQQEKEYDLRKKEDELRKKQYDEFVNDSRSAHVELQKVDQDLREKKIKLYEREEIIKEKEEMIKEKERELNLNNNNI